jgi:hypothetical protein
MTRTRIHTYSDSRAAIAALALVWECTQTLEKQSRSNKVTLDWIRGHQGIPGNEESNKSDKEGLINSLLIIPLVLLLLWAKKSSGVI